MGVTRQPSPSREPPPLGAALPDLLANWHALNARLVLLNEREVRQLIALELADQRRPGFLKRLHQRWLTLVRERTWAELNLITSANAKFNGPGITAGKLNHLLKE